MAVLDHHGLPWRPEPSANGNPDRWDRDLLSGDMGRTAIPHVITFSSIMGNAWKAYWHGRQDEAYKDSRPDALAMRRDPYLMGLLQERILSVSSLRWHIEGHDEKNAHEIALKDQVEGAIRKTPHLRKFVKCQLQALWYGRYGCQMRPVWRNLKGQKTLTVAEWGPVNGDKIGYRWDGTPYVLVSPSWADRLPSAETFPTTMGRGLILEGRWRERFVIHAHEIEDGDFFDPESAGAIHGIGLRHRLYWYWWMKQEYMEWIGTYLERVGLGITLWMYDASNPEGESRARSAAREAGRRTNLFVPTWPDSRTGAPVGGVERIETPVSGVDALRTLQDKLDEVMERFVVGQSMSGGSDEGNGLGGTGRAKFAESTKGAITEDDANSLGESLTGDARNPGIVWLIQTKTRPDMAEVPLRWVFDVESTESKEKLDAAKTLFDMNVPLRADEVRGAAGYSKPAEGDEVVEQPEEQEQGGPPQQEQREDPNLARQMAEQEMAVESERHRMELAQKQAQHEQNLRHEEEKHKHSMTREGQKTAFAAQRAQRKAALQAQAEQRKALLRQQQMAARAQQQQAYQPTQQQQPHQPAQPAQPSEPWVQRHAREEADPLGIHALVEDVLGLPDTYSRDGAADQYGWEDMGLHGGGPKHRYKGTPPDKGNRYQISPPGSRKAKAAGKGKSPAPATPPVAASPAPPAPAAAAPAPATASPAAPGPGPGGTSAAYGSAWEQAVETVRQGGGDNTAYQDAIRNLQIAADDGDFLPDIAKHMKAEGYKADYSPAAIAEMLDKAVSGKTSEKGIADRVHGDAIVTPRDPKTPLPQPVDVAGMDREQLQALADKHANGNSGIPRFAGMRVGKALRALTDGKPENLDLESVGTIFQLVLQREGQDNWNMAGNEENWKEMAGLARAAWEKSPETLKSDLRRGVGDIMNNPAVAAALGLTVAPTPAAASPVPAASAQNPYAAALSGQGGHAAALEHLDDLSKKDLQTLARGQGMKITERTTAKALRQMLGERLPAQQTPPAEPEAPTTKVPPKPSKPPKDMNSAEAGEWASSSPPGKRGGPNSPLRTALQQTFEDLSLLIEYKHDRLVDLPRLFAEAKKHVPNLTPEEFKQEVKAWWNDRSGQGHEGRAEMHVQNETHKLTPEQRAMAIDDMPGTQGSAYYYLHLP